MAKNRFTTLSYLFSLIAAFSLQSAHAEGSKELIANGGYRAFLISTSTVTSSFVFPTLGTMKAYVKAGETIEVASSAQGIGSGTINLRAPNGLGYSSGGSTTVGFIANRTQEISGPLPTAGGFTPYTHVATAAEEGIWEIDFISPSNGVPSENPSPVLASDPWVQDDGKYYIAAFDVSVRNVANTAFLSGRVYTNIFNGLLGDFLPGFNGIFQILTKDGYKYSLDNNGQAGNGFSFFVNNKGFRQPDGTASFKSVNSLNSPNILDPRSPDTQADITYKIFFNPPANDLPLTAPQPGNTTTWVLNPIVDPALTNFKFTGTEGTPNKSGTNPLGAVLAFTANKNGTYIVYIDVNKNGVFTDPIDRKISGLIIAGANQTTWDGLDGLGNKVPAGNYTSNLNVVLFGGEVHFPFFDVERNVNGIKLTRNNGTGSPDFTVYWDDSDIALLGTPSNPIKNTAGINSQINGHKWGTTGNTATDYGDGRGMDTYSYIAATPLASAINFQVQEADLEVRPITSTASSSTCAGQTVVYTIAVKNNGPSDVTGTKFNINFTANLTNIVVTDAATTGTSTVTGGAYANNNYTATIDLANGAVHTFTVTAKAVPTNASGAIVTATILRTIDFTDPDATNPDAAPPTDASSECSSLPSGPGCNNIQTFTIIFISPPNAGPDQSTYQDGIVTLTDTNPGTWSQIGATPVAAVIATPAGLTTQISGLTDVGKYLFLRTNALGCTDTVEITVVSKSVDIPTIFTPNGDGKNDTFTIPNIEAFPGSQLYIYNRLGNEVYRSLDYKNTWTGAGLSEGTYYYVLNRKEPTGSFTTYKGWLFLKR